MLNGIKQQTIVKPGGVVELTSTELPEGAVVEVIVLVQATGEAAQELPPLTSFIGAAPGNFATPEEADQFIRQERDAWDY